MTSSKINIPRPEYPRPQFVREQWMNLNGIWEFEIDNNMSGKEQKYYERSHFNDRILVPYVPESKLSGVEYTDFMLAVWYKKTFDLPSHWSNQRVILHFGAVDYKTEVWVNGKCVGTPHLGGYSSFSYDITPYLQEDTNTIIVYVEDDTRSRLQPSGKQSPKYHSHGCFYTRSTGIWQTVWLEAVSDTYIRSVKYYPDAKNSLLHVEGLINGSVKNKQLKVTASYKGDFMGSVTSKLSSNFFNITLSLSESYLWEVGNPHLYDLEFTLSDQEHIIDEATSYFGLRSLNLTDKGLAINDKLVFQRLVLDQGYYPDGIYTAPCDADLKQDIELSMALGFNGARLHEKIFEPRFLYWADRLGYIVWGEHANWGLDNSHPHSLKYFLPEWIEALERDFNHPSIIGWCPFNETWNESNKNNSRQDDDLLRVVYQTTKAIDKTRPVIDTSGNFHVITDIYDVHDYEQDVAIFSKRYGSLKDGRIYEKFADRQTHKGEPVFMSEYGGIKWSSENDQGWGYGNAPRTEQEFLDRYKGLTECLLNNPDMSGFCYTQLYDVEQEVNGLYTYDRKPKFDSQVIKKINQLPAALEMKHL